MTERVDVVLDAKNELGEGPVWNEQEGRLYWVDVTKSLLFSLDPESGDRKQWNLGEYPGSYAFRSNKPGLIMAFRRGLALVTLNDDGSITKQAIDNPLIDCKGARFNDGACDRRGRFWTGQIDRHGIDPVGVQYRVDPDLSVHRMDGGIVSSNGFAFSPDDKTMYYVDSRPGMVFAYDYDIETGINSNKRIFLDFRTSEGKPDGCTVDADGCLWVAEIRAGRIGRYRPDGTLDRHIPMPVFTPTSVMFGGKDLDTLFITSLSSNLSPEEREKYPLSGALMAVRPGVTGLPESRFAG